MINFLRTEKIILSTGCGIDCMNKYDNKNSFIFLDPPYLMSCNDFYKTPDLNVYEYLCETKPINKFKAHIMLCLNDDWIVRLLFKKFIVSKYDKHYETKHTNVQHLIIRN